MAKSEKKAYLVDISFRVRVIVDENCDPNVDPEFDRNVFTKLRTIMSEGVTGISDNIENWEEDTEVPYDPELDD